MKNIKFIGMLLLAATITLGGCSKEDSGLKGDQGQQGEQGVQGPIGEKGENGSQGEKGEQGVQGPKGENGNNGSQGPKGEKGDRGPKGENGNNGPRGVKGETGDRGPRGVRGLQGLPGPNGTKGDKGETGNANVIAYTLNIKDSVWTKRSKVLYLKIDAHNVLTNDRVRNWIVLVYVHSTDFYEWALLPYYSKRNIRVTADYREGQLSLERDQDGEPHTPSLFIEVKLVLIEPSRRGTISQKSNPHPDFSDYEAVKEYYHLD